MYEEAWRVGGGGNEDISAEKKVTTDLRCLVKLDTTFPDPSQPGVLQPNFESLTLELEGMVTWPFLLPGGSEGVRSSSWQT